MSRLIGTVILCAGLLFSFAACAGGSGDAANANVKDAVGTKNIKNIGIGKKVYLASPMFNQGEKDFNGLPTCR